MPEDVLVVRSRVASSVVLAVLSLVGTACSHTSLRLAHLPTPSLGQATTVAGQPPVVWVSGQTASITSHRVNVTEQPGSRLSMRRLAAGATKFFRQDADAWAR